MSHPKPLTLLDHVWVTMTLCIPALPIFFLNVERSWISILLLPMVIYEYRMHCDYCLRGFSQIPIDSFRKIHYL